MLLSLLSSWSILPDETLHMHTAASHHTIGEKQLSTETERANRKDNDQQHTRQVRLVKLQETIDEDRHGTVQHV